MEFFGISSGEFLVIAVVALAVAGPQTLRQGYTALTKFLTMFRNISASFRVQLQNQFAVGEQSSTYQEVTKDLQDITGKVHTGLDALWPQNLIRETVQAELQAWTQLATQSTTLPASDNSTSPAAKTLAKENQSENAS